MISLSDVEAARDRTDELVCRTPLEFPHAFSEITGSDVSHTLETFPPTGAL